MDNSDTCSQQASGFALIVIKVTRWCPALWPLACANKKLCYQLLISVCSEGPNEIQSISDALRVLNRVAHSGASTRQVKLNGSA